MKKILRNTLIFAMIMSVGMTSACSLTDSGSDSDSDSSTTDSSSSERPTDENDVSEIDVDSSVYETTLVESDDESGTYIFEITDTSGDTDSDASSNSGSDSGTSSNTDSSSSNSTNTTTVSLTITCSEGTEKCYSFSEDATTLTFSGFSADSVYAISGSFYGDIVIDASDDYQFELSLTGFTLTSYSECPLYISSGDKVTISAKKDTDNYIYDMRDEVTYDDDISASVYALCDLDIQGKGNLYVKSVSNNGIHTKDDLDIKNVSLQVECEDNALKGNDSVTIQSGYIVLIARTGDGIKTTNSDVSSKGNQRGTITISGGKILIYAACDGIDASYNVDINEDTSTPSVQIYTDKYSEYSEEVTATSEDIYYIRYTSNSYKFSICYTDSDGETVWYSSSSYVTVTTSTNQGGQMIPGGSHQTTYYYYPITKPSGYTKMQVYMYSSQQTQGQSTNYTAVSDSLTVNDTYDTISVTKSSSKLNYSWTNYTTTTTNNNMAGGGMSDTGNTDKGDYSTKGIKADNAITISAGDIQISSYDDGIHANCDNELENGNDPLGNVTISGGTIYVYSNDDGIHGDGTTTISGGAVTIGYSYEGIEGAVVKLSGGTTSVISSDDGVNGTETSGQSVIISGGYLYVYAGGDGVDSNTGASGTSNVGGFGGSSSSYNGLLISGGYSVIISTGASDSCIDTEVGYTYTGGYVLGMDSGGMSDEATNCSNFSSVGISKTNQSLTKGYYLTATYSNVTVAVKLPISISGAHVVFLCGSKSASVSSSSSSNLSFDSNGVCWSV